MGIIVCLSMLLGLVALFVSKKTIFAHAVMIILLLTGLWNFAWYGTQNLDRFWGWAGLISGLFMMAAAMLIYLQNKTLGLSSMLYKSARGFIIAGLGLSFLLYAVTLVQLNLGMDIIR